MSRDVSRSGRAILLCALLSWASVAAAAISVLGSAPDRNARLQASSADNGSGARLVSPGGRYWLTMQTDGNLVLYRGDCMQNSNPGCAVWNSRSFGTVGDYFMAVQNDGNLVVYRGRVAADAPPGAEAGLQPVWNSQTARSRGYYQLSVEDDGNLVLWSANASGVRQSVVWSIKPVASIPVTAVVPAPEPPAAPVSRQSLTGAWVHSADGSTHTPDNKVIVVQDGNQVTLVGTYRMAVNRHQWQTYRCVGQLSGNEIPMQCRWAEGGNPMSFADWSLVFQVSPDRNHIDSQRLAPGSQESHYSRVP